MSKYEMNNYATSVEKFSNAQLLFAVQEEVQFVTYHTTPLPCATVVAQLHLKNGAVIEGHAHGSDHNKKQLMERARKDAVNNFLQVKRYCVMQQLADEAEFEKR